MTGTLQSAGTEPSRSNRRRSAVKTTVQESVDEPGFPPGGLAVVVGASGGIGRALLENLEGQACFSATIGLGRSTWPVLELTDESSIVRSAQHVRQLAGDVRLVIDATGFLHGEHVYPHRRCKLSVASHRIPKTTKGVPRKWLRFCKILNRSVLSAVA